MEHEEHPPSGHTPFDVPQLGRVIYSSGKVFDGLQTGRLDTENFLRTGSLITTGTNVLLTIPLDYENPEVRDRFNGLTARAYTFDEYAAAIDYLRSHGLVSIEP